MFNGIIYNRGILTKILKRPKGLNVFIKSNFKLTNKDIGISIKHIVTKNLNHDQNSKVVHVSYLGAKYRDLKFGINTIPGDSALESELSYTLSF